MYNQDIRTEAKASGVFLYEIAEKIGVSEPTLTRMLRKELANEKKATLRAAISEIYAEKNTAAH